MLHMLKCISIVADCLVLNRKSDKTPFFIIYLVKNPKGNESGFHFTHK